MDRHFGIPVAFAAAAHVALLFGFPKAPVAMKPSVPPERTRVFSVDLVEDPEPPQATASDTATTKPDLPDITPPRLPEPAPTIENVPFKQPVPPLQPFDPDSVVRVAPTALAGVHDIGSKIGSVVSSVFLDNSPRTRFQASPVYPMQEKTRGINGEVVVEFIVDEAGNVLDPHVVNSSDRAFEENTLRAVAKWKFEPGRRDGKVVRFRMSVPIVFKLNE